MIGDEAPVGDVSWQQVDEAEVSIKAISPTQPWLTVMFNSYKGC